ncbi:MAG: DUF4296 domain-containing protein [Bacteroidia bacterium]|nr:DUF4296 domain-containing protein [Bacteroidia bacterium]
MSYIHTYRNFVERSMIVTSMLLVVYLLSGCSGTLKNVPTGIIAPDQFTEIVLDIRLAEAHQKVLRQKGRFDRDLLDSSYQLIYKLHGVSEKEVVASYEFYLDHPEWMEKLSADAIERLNKMEE